MKSSVSNYNYLHLITLCCLEMINCKSSRNHQLTVTKSILQWVSIRRLCVPGCGLGFAKIFLCLFLPIIGTSSFCKNQGHFQNRGIWSPLYRMIDTPQYLFARARSFVDNQTKFLIHTASGRGQQEHTFSCGWLLIRIAV